MRKLGLVLMSLTIFMSGVSCYKISVVSAGTVDATTSNDAGSSVAEKVDSESLQPELSEVTIPDAAEGSMDIVNQLEEDSNIESELPDNEDSNTLTADTINQDSTESNTPVTGNSNTDNSEQASKESVTRSQVDSENTSTQTVETAQEEPGVKQGWILENQNWFYYENDVIKKGWHLLDDNWFYLHPETGARQTGWVLYGGSWFFLNHDTGIMQKEGWVLDQYKWYYLDPATSARKTGWISSNGNKYYADPNTGEMQTGWLLDSNNWYFLNSGGVMATGWIFYENNWYYLDGNGVMQTDWVSYQGNWYYLNPLNGIMQKEGWVLDQGKWYYIDPVNSTRKTGWIFTDGFYYYADPDSGEMQTGWIFYQDNWYYLNSGGVMQTGWVLYNGNWYYLNAENGIMQKEGWILDQGKWYYLDSVTSARKTGWISANGFYYYTDPNSGEMQTGWILHQNNWYYLNSGGVMQTGWIVYQNSWYFLNTGGAMETGWVFNDNSWYYINGNGIMQTGWQVIGNQKYYLSPLSGVMQTGWFMDQSRWYYAYPSGVLAQNTAVGGFQLGQSGVWLPEIVNPNQVYTYETMAADIALLQQNYPYLIKTEVIGNSVDGRNIYAVKVGNGQKEITINGSHHAREHMTTNLLMEMIEQYAKSYADGTSFSGYDTTSLLNNVSIWFVPMVNPDGVSLVQKGHASAKNPQYVLQLNNYSTDFSSWKANIRGVDLNRQYPADWANISGNTGRPSSQNFKGYSPLSEPEAIALYNFTRAHNFKTAVAYHSSGQILYWYFNQDSSVYNRDYNLALKYGALTGYSLVNPTSSPSGGGYTDWFIQDMRQPGFTPEISPYTYNKPVPLSNYASIWEQNKAAGLMLALDAMAR
ncbi:M14 family zinc carboxypeptidase [Bacillus sp. T33-2]|uniref:M14 family zinc carboxypeptidase n=1 Tax=Bacillus sp. T33-2 TaxID=2054168 RepID=UPI000C79496E|nr:M14 family zinc carboxypeptidase [Bacillus sp. T33-2]PLR90767.1 hypothetical protein CVD19_22305 [Bacillus sp. T33-2]